MLANQMIVSRRCWCQKWTKSKFT